MTLFDTLDYLQRGDAVQQSAYRTLTRHGVMEKLEGFTPVLTGTIPIGLYTETSDLDIVCCFPEKALFRERIERQFTAFPGFSVQEKTIRGVETVLARLTLDGFPVELFGQSRPVKEQEAYRHMIIEHLLLERHGAALREAVLALKRSGVKTEPAFAQVLGLEGDPYLALLALTDVA